MRKGKRLPVFRRNPWGYLSMGALAGVLLFEALHWFLHVAQVSLYANLAVTLQSLGYVQLAFVVVFVVAYAAMRGAATPFVDEGHYRWLQATPWHPRMAFPLGTPFLCGTDLLCGLLILLGTFHFTLEENVLRHVTPVALIAMMAIFYWFLLVMAAPPGSSVFATVVAAVPGLPVVLFENPWWALAILLWALYLPAQWAARQLFRRAWNRPETPGYRVFATLRPEMETQEPPIARALRQQAGRRDVRGLLGWPFSKLGPNPCSTPKVTGQYWMALLVGWWAFVGIVLAERTVFEGITDPDIRDHPIEILHIVCYGTSFALLLLWAGIHSGYTVMGYAPPISLLGRLTTGRIIIPEYDRVFIGALAGLAVVAVAGPILECLGIPYQVAYPIGLTLAFVAECRFAVDKDEWQLTGKHRILKNLAQGGYTKI